MEPKWLIWAKELQALSQSGLAYSKDKFDIERFQRIRHISAEIMSEYTEIDSTKIKELFCNESGYQTPKVDVRGAVFKNDKILLVKEKIDGCWALPGGWADYNLSAKENIVKEMKEEAGLVVEPVKLIAVLDRNKHNTPVNPYGIYKIFILCKEISGSFEENIEIDESGYFDLTSLPELSETRNTIKQIHMCRDAYVSNQWQVLYD